MEHVEKQIPQQTNMPKNKVVLLLSVCIFLTAVIAGIGGYIGGKRQTTPSATITQVTIAPQAKPSMLPTASVAPALSMFGYDFPSDKFTCHGFPWRYDCFFPWDLKTKFQFKDKLSCQSITLDYLFNARSQYDGLQFNITQTQNQFTLEHQGNTILQPTGGGIDHDTKTPFSILQDNYDTLLAVRPSKAIW